MRTLFRSFERFGVDYLLISGQASILYGAATFSEDIDQCRFWRALRVLTQTGVEENLERSELPPDFGTYGCARCVGLDFEVSEPLGFEAPARAIWGPSASTYPWRHRRENHELKGETREPA